jgi:hypothetical protein
MYGWFLRKSAIGAPDSFPVLFMMICIIMIYSVLNV